MRALRTIVDMGGAALVSLLQPSYEVFHLFDNVMILTQGQIAFLGKREDTLGYFEALGYRCRSTLNPAEFLRTPPPHVRHGTHHAAHDRTQPISQLNLFSVRRGGRRVHHEREPDQVQGRRGV
jgi:ABC-type multidrug transport system ATPase subunit